jgi:hypothetical protein
VIDDLPVILFGNAINFHGIGFVDQVEQGREGAAETDATAAAVADIEHAFEFDEQFVFIPELSGILAQRVPGGCF